MGITIDRYLTADEAAGDVNIQQRKQCTTTERQIDSWALLRVATAMPSDGKTVNQAGVMPLAMPHSKKSPRRFAWSDSPGAICYFCNPFARSLCSVATGTPVEAPDQFRPDRLNGLVACHV